MGLTLEVNATTLHITVPQYQRTVRQIKLWGLFKRTQDPADNLFGIMW